MRGLKKLLIRAFFGIMIVGYLAIVLLVLSSSSGPLQATFIIYPR